MSRCRSLLKARVVLAGCAWSVAGVLAAGPLLASPGVAVAADAGSSAVTVTGNGPFSSLKLTVSQTAGLIDQVVKVSWSGAAPTQTGFSANYLQIMQCWGDDPAGPTRDHCEFGNSNDNRGGPQVTTRQLDAGDTFKDPAEKQVATPDNPYNYLPFQSAMWEDDPASPGHEIHPTVSGSHADLGTLFDSQTTNELPFNSTGADGRGESYFETLTGAEAPGLGCGSTSTDPQGNAWTPKCWMVIVPRGDTEVTGKPATEYSTLGLATSPLSASNWANRLVIPLDFTPIGLDCPLGSPEQRTSGQEIAAEAVSRWQAQLCKQSGTVFSYAKTSDDAARRQLLSPAPGLDFITQPVPTSTAGSSGVLYSPLAVSGAVIAFNIDYTLNGSTALKPLAGQRVPQINLTPRLVAKLLTQSYLQGAPAFDPSITQNPHNVQGLTYDPDFAAANPGLSGLNHGGGDVLMPFAPSDLTQELWSWINGDADARAFLDGAPDPWGMTVNPNYLKLTDTALPNTFPKQDPYCQPAGLDHPGQPPLCTLDARPYANDLHDAARSAARGDSLTRSQYDPTAIPPHYTKAPPQISGAVSVMAFTDAATAARYSLPVARLRNSAGQYVAPTTASLTAGVAGMVPSGVDGVLAPNPQATDPAAYPLTSITYAATVPANISAAARTSYADFLQYAVTGGQQPGVDVGTLPFGYAPLTQQLITQAINAEISLRNYTAPTSGSPSPTKSRPQPPPTLTKPRPTTKSPAPTSTHAPVASPPITSSSQSNPTSGPATSAVESTAPASAPASPSSTVTRTPTAPPSPSVAASTAASQPIAEVRRTPAVSGGSRYLFAIVLALGGLCALSGPTLLRFGGRRRQ
jgi:hypothetical protein